MYKSRKKTLVLRDRRYYQRGVTLLDTVIASAIVGTSFGAGYSYVSNSIRTMEAVSQRVATDDLDALVGSFLKSLVLKEAESDPCLSHLKLDSEVARRFGSLTREVSLSDFKEGTTRKEYVSFAGEAPSTEWQSTFSHCSGARGNSTCVILTPSDTRPKWFALAVISQESYDFKTGAEADHSTCDNAKVLSAAETSPVYAGIGIKANFVLLKAVIHRQKNDKKVVSRISAGEVFQSPSKMIQLAGSGSGELAQSPYSSCQVGRCTLPIPPDPGEDYAGWQSFSNRQARDASYCSKCERSRDYK